MIAEIEDGKVESKNLHVLSVCSNWAGRALLVAVGWWDILSLALRWYSRFVLQGLSWRHSSAGRREFQRLFWSLPTNPSRIQRADGILRLACNGDSTNSAGACGERYGGTA